MTDLENYFQHGRNLIEERLRHWLQAREGCPDRLTEAMSYSLLAPGKRLRPLLTLLACEASGGNEKSASDAGCAVEMIHTYSLIHDDLPAMDDDDTRRGRPTNHKKFGEALAILAGDGLLTLAFESLAKAYPAKTAALCCAELAKSAGCAGMVGGQVDDLAFSENPHPQAGLNELESLHRRKTGALIQSSLCLGVIVAQGERDSGPDSRLLERFRTYGNCIGLAFQIIDDLLDVEGNAEQLGKSVKKDADRGKLTYPSLLGIKESRQRAERLCEQANEQVQDLGKPGEKLKQLARYVLERKR